MANWIDINLEDLLPESLERLIDQIAGLAEKVAIALQTLGTVVSIIGAFVQGVMDALASAIQLLLDAVNNFLNDLLHTGVYICVHMPTSLALARSPDKWIEDIALSFNDLNDLERPQFSDQAYVGGLVIMGGAPNFQDLWQILGQLLKLFNYDFNYKPTKKTPEENIALEGTGRQPDWESTTLGETIPQLREMIQLLQQGLGLLSILPEIANAISQFGEWLKKKGDRLESLANKLYEAIKNLIAAIKQTGLYALPIAGKGGNTLLKGELRWSITHKEATNFPTFGDADTSGSATAVAGGLMLVTGGPSEAPVSALFNLFGIDYELVERDSRFFTDDPDLADELLREELEALNGLDNIFGDDTDGFADKKKVIEEQLKERAEAKKQSEETTDEKVTEAVEEVKEDVLEFVSVIDKKIW